MLPYNVPPTCGQRMHNRAATTQCLEQSRVQIESTYTIENILPNDFFRVFATCTKNPARSLLRLCIKMRVYQCLLQFDYKGEPARSLKRVVPTHNPAPPAASRPFQEC